MTGAYDRWNGQANAQMRLKSILDSWQQNPGRAPNGTGTTGLLSTDKQGYSDMLNEQTEAMNLQNQLSGKPPVNVKRGRDLGGMPANIGNDPNWWAQDMGGPFKQTIDSVPPSMRPFFTQGGR